MSKKQHTWYSPEQKMSIIQKYYGSNKTTDSFCAEEGLSKSTLYKWLQVYNEANNTSLLSTQPFQDVTPIIKQSTDSIVKPTIMKLTLPNNIILEFDSNELHNVLQEFK